VHRSGGAQEWRCTGEEVHRRRGAQEKRCTGEELLVYIVAFCLYDLKSFTTPNNE